MQTVPNPPWIVADLRYALFQNPAGAYLPLLLSSSLQQLAFNSRVMKSVPIRGSVGFVIPDLGLDMKADPTLPRIGTDFMTRELKLHHFLIPVLSALIGG